MKIFFTLVLGFCLFFIGSEGCSNKKNLSQSDIDDKSNLIMVLLKEGVDPNFLEKNISECQMKVYKPSSKSQNKWLYTYDCSENGKTKLIGSLLSTQWVLAADFIMNESLEKSSGTSGKKGKAKPGGN